MAKSTSRAPLEKEIEKKITRVFPNVLVLKIHVRDWPDRLFFLPHGRCFFIEFKRPGEHLRPGQELAKARLEKQGFTVHVVDSVDQGVWVLERECFVDELEFNNGGQKRLHLHR